MPCGQVAGSLCISWLGKLAAYTKLLTRHNVAHRPVSREVMRSYVLNNLRGCWLWDTLWKKEDNKQTDKIIIFGDMICSLLNMLDLLTGSCKTNRLLQKLRKFCFLLLSCCCFFFSPVSVFASPSSIVCQNKV